MNPPAKISLEFFPPRSDEMEALLKASLKRLLPHGPLFCTVSYGAGGSTREGTAQWVRRIRRDYGLDCAPHFAHVSHTREEALEIVREYVADGVRRMIALRGDLPPGGVPESARERGYSSTVDLVRDLRAAGVREVMVGAHPEHGGGDPAALKRHVTFVKEKLDAGATLAITQFFLDNGKYYRLRDAFAAAGIDHLLAPGIMPLHNYRQVFSFAARTQVDVPGALRNRLQQADQDPDAAREISTCFSVDQVRDLAANGVERFHIYTMNRAPLTAAICEALGLGAPGGPS